MIFSYLACKSTNNKSSVKQYGLESYEKTLNESMNIFLEAEQNFIKKQPTNFTLDSHSREGLENTSAVPDSVERYNYEIDEYERKSRFLRNISVDPRIMVKIRTISDLAKKKGVMLSLSDRGTTIYTPSENKGLVPYSYISKLKDSTLL